MKYSILNLQHIGEKDIQFIIIHFLIPYFTKYRASLIECRSTQPDYSNRLHKIFPIVAAYTYTTCLLLVNQDTFTTLTDPVDCIIIIYAQY